eukprot:scaffold104672_cov36-Prasinocladus_malaysianus.AAC.1
MANSAVRKPCRKKLTLLLGRFMNADGLAGSQMEFVHNCKLHLSILDCKLAAITNVSIMSCSVILFHSPPLEYGLVDFMFN